MLEALTQLSKIEALVIERQAGEKDGNIGMAPFCLLRGDTLCMKWDRNRIPVGMKSVLNIPPLLQRQQQDAMDQETPEQVYVLLCRRLVEKQRTDSLNNARPDFGAGDELLDSQPVGLGALSGWDK